MNRRAVRKVLLLVWLQKLSVDEAEEQLTIRTTSLNRDLILVVFGFILGAWVGCLSMVTR